MMTTQKNKPLMRCLGEFVGHIIHAVKSDTKNCEINKTVEEKAEGNVTLRRTTIDEIEIKHEDAQSD
jgi:hypothetical protein